MTTKHSSSATRRQFLQGTVAGSAAALVTASDPAPTQAAKQPHGGLIQPGDVILFQGDSITDAGRSRKEADKPNQQQALGKGYAAMAAAGLLTSHVGQDLKVFNRGISGNKVFQLADRWEADCLRLKPNLLSILIGVNDIWHGLSGRYDGTVEVYERDFNALLTRTTEALPHVKLVICEPFVLRCGAVDEKWFPEFDHYRAAAKRVAETFQALFVPFQSMFDAATGYAPPSHWAGDGVHPTAHGSALMAYHWLRAVESSKA